MLLKYAHGEFKTKKKHIFKTKMSEFLNSSQGEYECLYQIA